MSLIEELLNRHCPDGVEYKQIKDISKINRGVIISKKYIEENKGDYPVYSSQTENNGELGRINNYAYDGEYLTWTTDGANAGSVFYRNEKFNITNVCGLIKITDINIITKFIYYILRVYAPKYVNRGMGNCKLMSNVMESILIPLPPIEIQKEIVRILDIFTEKTNQLQELLNRETILRKKQYEYYQNKLLFNTKFNKVKMSDICTVNQGLQIPISQRKKEDGKNRYFYITVQFLKGNNKDKYYIENPAENVICDTDDILVTRTGSTGKIITGVKGCFHNNFFKLNFFNNINKRYIYYVLNTKKMYEQMLNAASGGTVPDLPHKAFYKLEIYFPPLEEQKRIVKILDRF
ncbi:restriction endonuclease subunit S, partial [Brachyspira innocens]